MSDLNLPVYKAASRHAGLLFLFLAALFAITGGCNSTDSADSGTGEVVIGITDAQGDAATYTVDVLSLTLKRLNGAVVETLPLSTRIDFSQYTELTEFLTAATVPSGVYTSVTMVLGYSGADIQVEDAAGNTVPVSMIQDIDGNPVTTLEVAVQLDGQDKLLVAPGLPVHLTLDFDLKASNSVDFSGAEPVLTVSPFLIADVELENPKPHRLRGPLASVDVADESFELIVRPFRHGFAADDRRFGTLEVQVDAGTVYEIDGASYQGAAGLSGMAAQPEFTAVIALGELQRVGNRRQYVASQVYAGSSVPHGEDDVVTGHVIARSGDTLQLKGATLLRADGSVVFNDTVTVELKPTTIVTKQLDPGSHSISEISVGQRLTVFGAVSGDAANGFVMDADNGVARLLLTTINGSVAQTDSPLAVDVGSIGLRAVGIFDFSGTGVDAANDADPDFYEINTGTLNLSGVILNDPIKVSGFVREFGMAPEDFDARTLVLVAQANALMTADWTPSSNTAVSDIRDKQIALDLNGSGRFHHVVRAGVLTDLGGLASGPVLAPNSAGTGIFVIIQQQSIQVFLSFAQFSESLALRLNNSARVKFIKAKGSFADDTASMTVRRVTAVLD